MPVASKHLLAEMGIVVWRERREGNPDVAAPAPLPEPTECEIPPTAQSPLEVSAMSWSSLEAAVSVCQRCELHRSRTQTVFGVGAEDADMLIIGEAPGQNEDRQGEPFVGRAGQLLNAMLSALGFARDAVYIANTLKCRPPGNRDPKRDETEACAAFLGRQIALLEPKMILAVGRIAAQTLLDSQAPLGRMRGRVHRYPGTEIPLIVTYHPAYLLRSPAQKREAWNDLLLARQILQDTGA